MSNPKDVHQHMNVDISVRNFGPIAEADIALRPLTVFIGPSNTGKTYFSMLIYALHKTFDGFSNFPISLIQDMLFEILHDPLELSPEVEKKIQVIFDKLNTKGGMFTFSDLPDLVRNEIQFVLEDFDLLLDELESCLDVDSGFEMSKSTDSTRRDMTIGLEAHEKNQKFWNYKMVVSESDVDVTGEVDADMPFRSIDEQRSDKTRGYSGFLKPLNKLGGEEREVYYLPATRSGFMQSHSVISSSLVARATRTSSEHFPEIPVFTAGLSDFLQQIILYKADKKPNSDVAAIADVLESNILSGKIIWAPSPSGYPEFLYRPREMGEEIRLSQASSMVSELAPLVLFLRGIIKPGDTLIIEEPEAHLHPGAQTEIAATLARLVRVGVRVVVTTHSDWLLKEIGNLIREGILNKKGALRQQPSGPERWLLPDEVGAWHFYREKPVEPIRFTNLDGIEHPDYEDLALNLYNRSAGLHNQLEQVEDGIANE